MNLPPEARTDVDLWSSAIGGSADAWGEIFLRHNRAIYNFCFRRTGQWSVAEDLTSAVFLEAWRRRLDTKPDAGSAMPWLYGIATMLTSNHHRALRRYRSALQRIPPPQATFGGRCTDSTSTIVGTCAGDGRCCKPGYLMRQQR